MFLPGHFCRTFSGCQRQLSESREDTRVSTGKHLPAWDKKAMEINRADVAELVDARNLKSPGATEIAHLSDLTQVAVSRRKFAS
jgi:hypothetical protein